MTVIVVVVAGRYMCCCFSGRCCYFCVGVSVVVGFGVALLSLLFSLMSSVWL